MKYSKKRVKRICDLLSKDSYTTSEICSFAGISESTYYEWQANKPEFSEAVTRARERFNEIIVKEAKESLRKLVNGYEVDEKKTVYIDDKQGRPKIKEQVTIKKHIQPNPHSVQFVLTNKTGGEYKNYQTNELTGKDGKPLIPELNLANLDDAELKTYYELMRKAKGNGS